MEDEIKMAANKAYRCNCPDFTKQQSFLINSPYESYLETRDWSDSNAGVDRGQYCKHIWAVRLLRGEVPAGDIPFDVPIEKTPQGSQLDNSQEIYQQGYGGHDFSGNWGVAPPRKYKGG